MFLVTIVFSNNVMKSRQVDTCYWKLCIISICDSLESNLVMMIISEQYAFINKHLKTKPRNPYNIGWHSLGIISY